MNTPNITRGSPPDESLSEAAVRAAELRAQLIISVNLGYSDVAQIVVDASKDEGKPLRKLRIVQVLAAQEDWSMYRSTKVVESLRDVVKYRGRATDLTVSWLVDPRSKGKRVVALADALAGRAFPTGATPWTGDPL